MFSYLGAFVCVLNKFFHTSSWQCKSLFKGWVYPFFFLLRVCIFLRVCRLWVQCPAVADSQHSCLPEPRMGRQLPESKKNRWTTRELASTLHSSCTSHQQQWMAGRVCIHSQETAALFPVVTVGAGRRALVHCRMDGGEL